MTNPDDPTRSPVSAPFRLVLAGVLAVLLVAATTWFVIATVQQEPFGFQQDGEGAAATAQEDREHAMSRASEFVRANFTYHKSDLEDDGSLSGYLARLEPLMTTEAQPGLQEAVRGLEELIPQGFSRSTTIDATGVESLNEDAAEVLVTGTFEGTGLKGKPTGITPFQMVVALKQVHGEWMVDDFNYVGGEQP